MPEHGEVNAEVWAGHFMHSYAQQSDRSTREGRLFDLRDMLRNWFANAIESGITEGYSRAEEELREQALRVDGALIKSWADDVKELDQLRKVIGALVEIGRGVEQVLTTVAKEREAAEDLEGF